MKLFIIVQLICVCFLLSAQAGDPPKKTPALLEKGKTLYAATCATCHGVNGDGMGDAGKYMSPKPRNFTTDKFKKGEKISEIFNEISNGLEGTAMTGFATLPEDDRWALAYFVLTFKK